MKIFTTLIICLTVGLAIKAQSTDSYIPAAGYVSTEDVAVKIAEAVLVPIYGKKKIEDQKPLVAKLDGDIWTVTGTFDNGFFVRRHGGVALIEISKTNGKILRVTHGK